MPYDYPCKRSHSISGHCSLCQTADCNSIISSVWGGSSEPQIIHELFFSSSAVKEWTNYLHHWLPSLRYAGVFVHQRPYCEFNALGHPPITATGTHSCRCELGDLLIVFTDVPAQRRVAALLQAKMAGGWPPSKSSPDQWELYTHWPVFRYTPRSPHSSPGVQVRSVPFHGAYDPAAQYLQLDSRALTVETTLPLLSASFTPWDRTLNRILNGGAGRDFSWNRRSATNEWDELIWDLLDFTHKCAMPGNVIASSSSTGDRGVGSFLLERLDVFDATDGQGPGNQPPSGSGPEDGFGIPLIHLIRGAD